MMSSTAPKVSRIFSVLVTRVRWLLEHHPLDASCWNPPILARAYPFYSVPFFIFFLHLTVSKLKSLPVFFLGGWGPNASPAGFQVSHHIQPPSRHLRPEKCGGSGKLMKTCDLRCASDLFSARWVPYFPIFLATHLSVVLVFFPWLYPWLDLARCPDQGYIYKYLLWFLLIHHIYRICLNDDTTPEIHLIQGICHGPFFSLHIQGTGQRPDLEVSWDDLCCITT
jgi:hypothetical protein